MVELAGGVAAKGPDGPAIGVYDSGVGGLWALRECLTSASDRKAYLLLDEESLPLAALSPEQLRSRLQLAAGLLLARGARTLLVTAGAMWPHLQAARDVGIEVVDPVEALASQLAPSQRRTALCPGPLLDSGLLRGLGVDRAASSDGLDALVERWQPHDEFLVDAVRQLCQPIIEDRDIEQLLLLDSHAWAVSGLLQRVTAATAVPDVAQLLARELGRLALATPGPNPDPRVEVLVSGPFLAEATAAAHRVLQLPAVDITAVELQSGAPARLSPTDVVLLVYAACDRSDFESVRSMTTGTADRDGRSVEEVLRSWRGAPSNEVTHVAETFTTGDLVGASGWRVLAGERHPFSHMWRVLDGRIDSLTIV